MALEATHMRFAYDLGERLGVQDFAAYITGSIYPDSRYVTKIDRALTHPKDFTEWNLPESDDFRKGWFTHLLCDKVQWVAVKEMRPDILEGEMGAGSPVWIRHTALKILQDYRDAKAFDVATSMDYLDQAETPNDEDAEQVKAYHRIFQDLYRKPDFTLEDYSLMWSRMNIPEQLGKALEAQVRAYSDDDGISDLLSVVYQRMLSLGQEAVAREI